MRSASSLALSNWTVCVCCRNRSCARTASAPGAWLGAGHCQPLRGAAARTRFQGLTHCPEGTELPVASPEGLEHLGGRAACERTRFLHLHTHPFAQSSCLPLCPHSKSGDNSSSSLGDVVTGTRRPTPPASGKSCRLPREWGGLQGGVVSPLPFPSFPCSSGYPNLSPPNTFSGLLSMKSRVPHTVGRSAPVLSCLSFPISLVAPSLCLTPLPLHPVHFSQPCSIHLFFFLFSPSHLCVLCLCLHVHLTPPHLASLPLF